MCSMPQVLTGQIQGYGYLKEVGRGVILVYSVPGWGNNVHWDYAQKEEVASELFSLLGQGTVQ